MLSLFIQNSSTTPFPPDCPHPSQCFIEQEFISQNAWILLQLQRQGEKHVISAGILYSPCIFFFPPSQVISCSIVLTSSVESGKFLQVICSFAGRTPCRLGIPKSSSPNVCLKRASLAGRACGPYFGNTCFGPCSALRF